MKYFLLLLSFFILISCSETAKVGCSDDSDCADDRICELESNSCVTCKATMCNYDNATGVCEANSDGKIHCAMGDCKEGFWDIDNDDNNGCEYSCSVTNNGVEICDTKDNNCDGKTDEGLDCSCNENESNTCIVAGTSCDGTQDCVSGSWGECTTNDTTVGVEICDNLDNDCNDGVDEDFKTNGVYTKDDHCGACNQKCEAIHGTNSCATTGTCNPICEDGWNDFDKNGLNGCETGCALYSLEEGKINKVILSSNGEYIIGDSDSFYKDGKILISYTKSNEFASSIVAKIIDKDGSVIKDEVFLASTGGGEFSIKPKVVMTDSYNYILYRDNYKNDGSKKVKLLIKDNNLNLGNSLEITPIGTSASIAKKNYVANNIFMVWSRNMLKIGGGDVSVIYFRSYDEVNSQLNTVYTVINSSGDDFIAPKITTANSYIAIAYCDVTGHGQSNLNVYSLKDNYTNPVTKVVDSFTNTDCNDFENTGSITSDGDSFYVSYVNNLSFNIKKYTYGLVNPDSHTEYDIRLDKKYSILGTDDENKIVNSSINYKNNNLLLAYSKLFITNAGSLGLINHKKVYQRLNSDLELKDTRDLISSLGVGLSSFNMSILYTDDNEIILQYENKQGVDNNIEIIRSSSCEN